MINELFDFIKNSPSSFHAIKNTEKILNNYGFTQLYESEDWYLSPNGKYYTVRNGSSLVAFTIPEKANCGFMITASHCDCPCFKIKNNAEFETENYNMLSVEKYGGMLCSTWLDRPLSIAGRVTFVKDNKFHSSLIDFKEPCCIIPNVAIHINRNANENASYNPAVDMLPIFESNITLKQSIAEKLNLSENSIKGTDLYLYNSEKPVKLGNYIMSSRLDDLECAFISLKSFTESENNTFKVYCLFDNEEVGSQTKQGAASTFLYDTLNRICTVLNISYFKMIAQSFMLSCDNAHAVHPNHPEYSDPNNKVYMNNGVVIKFNANQKYTTDAISEGIFKTICDKAKVPYQSYANRSDMAGGSTLGNIANTQVSLNTVDIGLAQLAMHSSYETAGKLDIEYMFKAILKFYKTRIKTVGENYIIE